jgi:phage regulator Rha-like protein
MFQLTETEKQQVVANCDHLKNLKFSPYLPFVFTEHGAVMLASVLNSERAIQVNLQIVRVFIKMREMLATHKDILRKLEEIEKKYTDHDQKIMLIFEYLKQLEQTKQEDLELKTRKKIGFKRSEE